MVFRNSIRSGTEFLLSMTKIPHDDILEGLYELRIRESEKLKTVLELYDLEINQIKLETDYHRSKTMVKRSIEQEIRNKNFEVRNGNYERSVVVKNQGTKQRVQRNLGDRWQWEFNGQCSGGDNCSFRHDSNKRGKMTEFNSRHSRTNALVFAQVSLKQARHTTFNISHGSGAFPERIDEQIVDDSFKFEMSLEAVLTAAAASKNRVAQVTIDKEVFVKILAKKSMVLVTWCGCSDWRRVGPRDRRIHCFGRVHLLVQGHRHIPQDPKGWHWSGGSLRKNTLPHSIGSPQAFPRLRSLVLERRRQPRRKRISTPMLRTWSLMLALVSFHSWRWRVRSRNWLTNCGKRLRLKSPRKRVTTRKHRGPLKRRILMPTLGNADPHMQQPCPDLPKRTLSLRTKVTLTDLRPPT